MSMHSVSILFGGVLNSMLSFYTNEFCHMYIINYVPSWFLRTTKSSKHPSRRALNCDDDKDSDSNSKS